MKVIMSGGGTGGHIYPSIAIAEEISHRHPDAKILFVGTEHGMEKKIVPPTGFPIKYITVSGFDRRHLTRNIKVLNDLRKGMSEARKILKTFLPDLVIGTGGYVCGPVVRSACQLGIPSFIHEQNAFPGLTNKLLSKKVDRVFLAFDDARQYFKVKNEPVTTGNPVRRAFSETTREEAREKLGISPEDFVVLGFGGSLGAKCINEVMMEVSEYFSARQNVRIFFTTGRSYYKSIIEGKHPEANHITYLEYIDNMPLYLAACDIAVTRSGALTVSEITASGRASIMIPSPNVTDNHQFFNAKVVADRGGAVLIEEKDLKEGQIVQIIENLIADRDQLVRMEKASAALGRTDAAQIICDTIGI